MLVTGAAGGVGRLAVQLANLAGAEVTAVVGRPERRTGLVQLGAADVVVGIEAATGRYDLILESVGGNSMRTASEICRPRECWSPTDARPVRTAPSTPTGSATTPAPGSRGCWSSPRSTASARHHPARAHAGAHRRRTPRPAGHPHRLVARPDAAGAGAARPPGRRQGRAHRQTDAETRVRRSRARAAGRRRCRSGGRSRAPR